MRAAVCVLWLAVAACSFHRSAATGEQTPPDAPPDGAVDAAIDAAKIFTDAPACTAIQTSTGNLVAPKLASPATIDGDLSEWSSICFVVLDDTTATVRNLAGETQFPHGRFAIAHDTGHVYFAAQVTGLAPLGAGPPPNVYVNDGIELYFDGDGNFTAMGYDADALQVVIDHGNQVQGFRNSMPVATSNISSATTLAADGVTYTMEVSVTPATFGVGTFGSTIGFDVAINDGNGTMQLSQLVWYLGCGSGACPNTTCAGPYCDEREFGTAMLAP